MNYLLESKFTLRALWKVKKKCQKNHTMWKKSITFYFHFWYCRAFSETSMSRRDITGTVQRTCAVLTQHQLFKNCKNKYCCIEEAFVRSENRCFHLAHFTFTVNSWILLNRLCPLLVNPAANLIKNQRKRKLYRNQKSAPHWKVISGFLFC